MLRFSGGNRSRVEIDVLLWLRPSVFSLSLTPGVSIFDLVSPFLHLPLLSLSFLFPLSFFSFSSVRLLSRPSVPLLRFVFRVAAFHFDSPKLPARCQTFDYWIARVFLLRQFFLLFSSFVLSLSLPLSFSLFRLISLTEKIRGDRSRCYFIVASQSHCRRISLFHARQIVELALPEKVRNCALQPREIAGSRRDTRAYARSRS